MVDWQEGEGDPERMLLSEDNLFRPGLSPAHIPGSHTGTTGGQVAPAWAPVQNRGQEGYLGAVQTIVQPCRQEIREDRVQLVFKLMKNGKGNKKSF